MLIETHGLEVFTPPSEPIEEIDILDLQKRLDSNG
jgi:hypothetical protein